MTNAIEVTGLTKSYGDHEAVKEIDLTVRQGEILAFLGPNGAGKTTTIEILEGFRERSGGDVLVLGEDPARAPLSWRERIGIVLQESEPVPELTALESVQLQAGYFRSPRKPEQVLDLVGLSDASTRRARQLSGGQRRRLDLALALIGNPSLVFLDEPTTGFDPSARRDSWGMIEALRDLGTTVLLTTHYMDEAEHLADRITVIAGGTIVANGTPAELATQVQAKTRIRWRHDPDCPVPLPVPLNLSEQVDSTGLATIETDDVLGTVHRLTAWALGNDVGLRDLSVTKPTLEEVYLRLVGESQ